MGTSQFAIPSLLALINDRDIQVAAVVTQPDKKTGRKQDLTPSPVKQQAKKLDIPILQPSHITNIKKELEQYKPDMIVVAAYAQKLPQEILDIPKYGAFNVHGSLLPKYRGAACLQAPLLRGDKKTGVTIMKMDTGLDTGDIIAQKEIPLKKDDTVSTAHDRVAEAGAKILPAALNDYIQGNIRPKPQNGSRASYIPALTKKDGKVDWQQPAEQIEKQVRALNPWPGCYSRINMGNKKLFIKILKISPDIWKVNEYPAGTLFTDRQENLGVQCGRNALNVEKLQPEGKKPLSAAEFINGYRDLVGRPLE